MKRTGIAKISVKLNWDKKAVSSALKELSELQTVVTNWRAFFNICLSADNPKQRTKEAFDYLKEAINKEGKGVSNLVPIWLYNIDPAFNVLGVFNLSDIQNDSATSEILYHSISEKGSFWIQKACFPGLLPMNNKLLEPASLCDDFIHEMLGSLPNDPDVNTMLYKLASEYGFMVFNLKAFRLRACSFSYDPNKKPLSDKLLRSLKSDRQETLKKDWLNYVLIELVREKKNINKNKTFELICRALGKALYRQTTKVRYYEKRREVLKIQKSHPFYGVKNIIAEYQLGKPVIEYLQNMLSSSEVKEIISKYQLGESI